MSFKKLLLLSSSCEILRLVKVNQKGFSAIFIIILLIVVGIAIFAFISFKKPSDQSTATQNANSNEPPLKIKSIGVNLDYFDSKTGKAGDFVFTKAKLIMDRIFMDYGFFIPASSASPDKNNPQSTFLLPMGTKVRSLVDGVVVAVPQLYSGDYSVQVAVDTNSPWRYETEHVINPIVKEGDVVKAGQVVAEVSPHDSQHNNGFGLVEIGILHGGEGPPEHVCPFAYLDPSVKDDILRKIKAFYKSWEEYRGDQALYPDSYSVPGCLTLNPIEG